MTTYIYAIYDNVAEEYGPLFESKSDAVALRQFHQLLKESPNKEDYDLYCFGRFEREKAQMLIEEKFLVMSGKNFKDIQEMKEKRKDISEIIEKNQENSDKIREEKK